MNRTATPTDGTPHRDRSELLWIRDVLGGIGTGPSQRFLIRPNSDDPQLLLPVRPTAAAVAALQRHHDDRSFRERAISMAGNQLARFSALSLAGGDVVELEPFALVESLARVLGEPLLIPAVSLGPRRRNRKPVLQLLRPDGVAVGFAKVGWSQLTSELVMNEANWLRRVDGRLPAGLFSPAVLHQQSFEFDGYSCEVVVTAPLSTSLFSHRRGPIPIELIVALARVAGEGFHTVAELPMISEWRDSALSDLVDLGQLVTRHGTASVEVGMWHGDLTPWNTATTNGVSSVWDWEFAGGHRPVGFDALHLVFESVRRAAAGNERAAIVAVVDAAPGVLGSIEGKPVTSSTDAVIDLYLCELLARETRLAGEGWRPEHLGPLDQHLREALDRRLTLSQS